MIPLAKYESGSFLTALNIFWEFLCLFFVDLIDDDNGFQFVVELTFIFFNSHNSILNNKVQFLSKDIYGYS